MTDESAPQREPLAEFVLGYYRFHVRARTALSLPAYKGAVLRGGFGQVFRRISCLGSGRGFGECLLGQRCPYHYIFETPPPAGSVVLSKVPTAPHPFVLEPPLDPKRAYEPGEELIFHLVLIGKAIDFLPYFVVAFDELGRVGLGEERGTYALESISALDPAGNPSLLYDGRKKLLSDPQTLITPSPCPSPCSSITLSFLTPTRLKYQNKLSERCDFHVFFRNLIRRLALLDYFHCRGVFPKERKEFLQKAMEAKAVQSGLRWVDWERYSSRQQTRMTLGGFVGRVTYQGDFSAYGPYLLLGKYTHVGKGTSFGLGKYELDWLEEKVHLTKSTRKGHKNIFND